MRIAIVNDMRLAVEALRRAVAGVPGYEVAWVAMDGAEAVRKCAEDLPDLILMDLIMPVMDGVQATCRIMKETPCAILVVTATVSGNAAKVFEAMGCGALDAVATPTLGSQGRIEGAEALLTKMTMLGRLIKRSTKMPMPPVGLEQQPLAMRLPPLVAIGASTGGPKVLAELFSGLNRDLGVAIVVIQHVDVQFAKGLAQWLGSLSSWPVLLARTGERPAPNQILIAATNDHLVLTSGSVLQYTAEPVENVYRPSVDAFFLSAAQFWPRKDLAILLTGMGRDGAQGMLELRRRGWRTIAQDEKTSVLYGMPKAAVEIGAALAVQSPAEIKASIERFAREAEGA